MSWELATCDISQLNVSDAQGEALFASALQPSDTPTAYMVAEAITCALRRFGTGGCVGMMAQEFGDHPDAAAERMCWARQLAAQPQDGTDRKSRWGLRNPPPHRAGGDDRTGRPWQTTRRHHANTRREEK